MDKQRIVGVLLHDSKLPLSSSPFVPLGKHRRRSAMNETRSEAYSIRVLQLKAKERQRPTKHVENINMMALAYVFTSEHK